MKYEKIVKWVLAALFAVGVVFSFYGFVVGFESNGNAPVDNMLYCAYAFALVTILAVLFGVVVIGGMNNPKSLLKLLIGLVVGGAVIAVAYVLAPGTPAIGYLGEPVSDGTLKLVDTVLNLTYFLFGGALLTLVAGDMSPAVVAGGMKVALITTVGGLIVAVILQIFYNYILSQVESLTIEMEDASISLMDILVKYKENK